MALVLGIVATVGLATAAKEALDGDYQARGGALIGEPVAFAMAVGVIAGAAVTMSTRRLVATAAIGLGLPTLAWTLTGLPSDGFMGRGLSAWSFTVVVATLGMLAIVGAGAVVQAMRRSPTDDETVRRRRRGT